jgi:energy-coupling factor transporter transmembrane protein EcfT
MDIGAIDYYANFGNSFIHRLKPGIKIIFVVSLITSIVLTKSLIILCSIYLFLLAFIILSKVPALKVILLASYPAIFAIIFAVASWNGNWAFSLLIILKALSASLCMVLLIITTSYPRVFASLRPVIPTVLFDALLLTYRSVFLLLGLLSNLFNALKIRGGFSNKNYFKRLKNLSSGLGLLVIRGFDLSHNYYGVLNIRGYAGNLLVSEANGKEQYSDYLFIVLGFSTLVLTVYCEEFDNKIIAKYFLLLSILFLGLVLTKSLFFKLKRRGL